MEYEQNLPFKVIRPHDLFCRSQIEVAPVARVVARELTGFNAAIASVAESLLASPVQLDALMAGLKPGEALVARLDFSGGKSYGVSVEILAGGRNSREATVRGAMLGRLLDAALASGLPFVDVVPRKRRKARRRLSHERVLAPAGLTLPLGSPPVRSRSLDRTVTALAHDWSETQRDVIVFSPAACGSHLAGLGAAIAAVETPLIIEVRMTGRVLDATQLKQLCDMRVRIAERLVSDANKYVRDQRYMDADQRLENLTVAGAGIMLEVSVHSRAPLDDIQVSALSAAMFGKPQAEDQRGHLSSLRSLYPREAAIKSFLDIVPAAMCPAIERRQVQQLRTLPGSAIGKVKSGQTISMPVDHPRSHTYVIGRPGSGKSTLLLNLILQDIEAGGAVVLIDPHGDLWSQVRAHVPAGRAKDVKLVHMGDPELQPTLNLLELGPGEPAEARARVVDTLYQLVRRLMFSGLTINATGPMFNKYFRAGLMLLLEGEEAAAQVQMLERIFTDTDYRSDLLQRPSVSPETKQQWKQILDVDSSDHRLENVVPWVTSKLTQLTQSAILRPILGATTTSLDFDRVLAEKQVCLINLANGRIGTEAAFLLGGVLTHRLEQSAKRQECVELEKRHTASVYFDEFHTFASEFLRPLMAETRKFGLRVTLANQTLSQMTNNDIDGGVFREVLGNCANTVVFAIDFEDARYLAPRFGGKVAPDALVAQPNYQAVCQFQTATGSLGPFSVRTLPPPPARSP